MTDNSPDEHQLFPTRPDDLEGGDMGHDFSGDILKQLAHDSEQPLPCEYDGEFVSAYYDGQLGCDVENDALLAQRIEGFEKHLPHCPPCSNTLGDLFTIGKQYKHIVCTLEESIDIDYSTLILEKVKLSQALLDETKSLPLIDNRYSYVALSCHLDQSDAPGDDDLSALSPQGQTILQNLTSLQQALKLYRNTLLDGDTVNTPNFWPNIERNLNKSNTVVPFFSRKWLGPSLVSTAAAVFLFMFAGKIMPGEGPELVSLDGYNTQKAPLMAEATGALKDKADAEASAEELPMASDIVLTEADMTDVAEEPVALETMPKESLAPQLVPQNEAPRIVANARLKNLEREKEEARLDSIGGRLEGKGTVAAKTASVSVGTASKPTALAAAPAPSMPSKKQQLSTRQRVNEANALRGAIMADSLDKNKRQSRQPVRHARTRRTLPVVYQTPEAYLFSQQADVLPSQMMNEDVSLIFIINEVPSSEWY